MNDAGILESFDIKGLGMMIAWDSRVAEKKVGDEVWFRGMRWRICGEETHCTPMRSKLHEYLRSYLIKPVE